VSFGQSNCDALTPHSDRPTGPTVPIFNDESDIRSPAFYCRHHRFSRTIDDPDLYIRIPGLEFHDRGAKVASGNGRLSANDHRTYLTVSGPAKPINNVI
jgi:hypothetical protein